MISLLAVPLAGVFSGWHVGIFSLPLYVPEILTLFAGAFLLSQKDFLRTISLRYDVFFFAFLLIALGLILSASVNDMTWHGYGRIKSWFLFPLLYGSILAFSLKKRMLSREGILRAVFFGGIFLGFSAILSIIGGGGFSYDHRLHGFFPSPNHLAMLLGTALVVGFFLALSSDVNRKMDRYSVFLGVLFLGALLLLTQSYAVILSVIGISGIGIASQRHFFSRKRFGIFFLGCALCLGILFPIGHQKWQDTIALDERSSLASRSMIWQAALRMIADHPLVGIGPGNFQREYLRYQQYFPPYLEWAVPHPHNAFLDLWLEGGVLGVTGFALLFWYWLSSATKHFFLQEKEGLHHILPLLLGIYCFLIGLTDVPFLRNDLAYFFTIAFVVSRSLTNVSDRSSRRGD